MSHSIYLITNIENGKQYVGQTKQNLTTRFKKHKNAVTSGRGCPLLRNSMKHHGVDKFVCELIVKCEEDVADEYEIMFIDLYDTVNKGYNILPGGGSRPGNMPKEVRIKCGEKIRTRDKSLICNIHEHRVGNNVGYVVRHPDLSIRSFCSMKYTMEEKLQAARRYLNKEEETVYMEPQSDTKLPKYISHSKSHGRDEKQCGYRIEFKLENGKKFTKSFVDSKKSMEEKLRLAKDFLSRCVFLNDKPIAPPAILT
jgi:group I intron endonuclease